jgi:hypothetical protein
MPTDKENVAFLYSIIRQLETKHVSWKIVAHDNDITNDHAARMRFHRLRQQFEGLTPKKRGPRKGTDAKGKCHAEFGDNASDEEDDKGKVKKERKRKLCKTEDSESEEDALAKHRAKKRPVGSVKLEPGVVKREPGEGPAVAGGRPNGVAPGAASKPPPPPAVMAQRPGNTAMMPTNMAFGMAPPPPQYAPGAHFGYRPMMPPGHYRTADPRLACGPQMRGPPSIAGTAGSRIGSPLPGSPMARVSLSGPPPSGQQMVGSPMARMSLSGPPPSAQSKPGPQMVGSPMGRVSPAGQQPQHGAPSQQQMQGRMVSRPAITMPLRTKNVPYERMPPRIGDVSYAPENTVPAMNAYVPVSSNRQL